jgi:hypothetical protein
MDHFNARNGRVVPEIADMQQCSVYFPSPTILDSAMEGDTSVKALWMATAETTAMAAAESPNNSTSTTSEPFVPCAVLGPMDTRATEEIGAITAAATPRKLLTILSSTRE